jgi:hypothetical protein
MKNIEANLKLEKLSVAAAKKFNPEAVVDELLVIRELAREEKDPTAVKILRLASEYIGEKGNFDIKFLDEDGGDLSDFEYLVQLLVNIQKDVNREEIQEIRDLILAELY